MRFADVPLFWRIDLEIFARSVANDPDYDVDNPDANGDEWSPVETALMNALATIKAVCRNQPDVAAGLLERGYARVELNRDARQSRLDQIVELTSAIATLDPTSALLANQIAQLARDELEGLEARQSPEQPPRRVLVAFGASGHAERFRSGEGKTFRAGEIVLKPIAEPYEATWIGDVLNRVVEDGFRIARPVRADTDAWVFKGWTAWQWVDGHSTKTRWDDVITAGERFHAALRDIPRPSFVDRRAHQWAVGDRAAFGEAHVELPAPIDKQVARLQARLGRLELPSQVIHGDLTENVLVADDLDPAIIDFSPYWRPTGFASAVVVADAIVWSGASTDLIERIQPTEARFDLLARALIFRLIAAALPRKNDPSALGIRADAYEHLVDHTERALMHDRFRLR